jgi:hypothetical protein
VYRMRSLQMVQGPVTSSGAAWMAWRTSGSFSHRSASLHGRWQVAGACSAV